MEITREIKLELLEAAMNTAKSECAKLFCWSRIEALKRNGRKAIAIRRAAIRMQNRSQVTKGCRGQNVVQVCRKMIGG